MKEIVVRGPVLSNSGYGVHSRQIAKWLIDRGENVTFQVLPWGETSWVINPDHYDGLIGKILQRTNFTPNKKYDVSFQIQLPNEWTSDIANYNVGITAGVECDKCNPSWISNILNMNKVVVPSEFTKNSFLNTSVVCEKKLVVIPESFDNAYLNTNIDNNLYNLTTNFNFLMFGQITGNNVFNDRKNIFYTLKWLCESFKDDKDVGIIIKTNSGRNTKIDKSIVKNVLKKVCTEINKGEYPKIYLLHGDLTTHEINSLYRNQSVKALVSLTRGEGYGLPILEGAVTGLPVIATNWSGHLQFMNEGKFLPIDYNLSEIHHSRIDNQIFMAGSKWAEPIEDDFKKKVKKFKSGSLIPKQWAEDLSKKLVEKFSHEEIVKLYENEFSEFLK